MKGNSLSCHANKNMSDGERTLSGLTWPESENVKKIMIKVKRMKN